MALSWDDVKAAFVTIIWGGAILGVMIWMAMSSGCGPVHLHLMGEYYGYEIPGRGRATVEPSGTPERIAQELIDDELKRGTETGAQDE